jgi:hypothetical protein
MVHYIELPPSLAAVFFVCFREQVAEGHLEGYGRSYQGGHGEVGGATLHSRHVLGVNPDEFCGLFLREPLLYPKLAESPPKVLEFPLNGRC